MIDRQQSHGGLAGVSTTFRPELPAVTVTTEPVIPSVSDPNLVATRSPFTLMYFGPCN